MKKRGGEERKERVNEDKKEIKIKKKGKIK